MSLRFLPRRLTVFALLAFLLASALPPTVAAADPAVPYPGGRSHAQAGDRFGDLDAAVRAGVLDSAVLDALRGRGTVDAIVTLNGSGILSRAAMEAPRGGGRSAAILGAIRPGLAAQKSRAIGRGGGGVRVLQAYEYLAATFVRFNSSKALLAVLQDGDVTGVRENRLRQRTLDQSLPLIGRTPTSPAEIGTNVSVAVLDTGVDYARAAFGSCTSPGVPASCRVPFVRDFAAEDGVHDGGLPGCNTGPDYCHGTNVSAIVLGVAPGARIIGLDVFQFGLAPDSATNAAMNWVVANQAAYNIRAANLSLGFESDFHDSTCWGSSFAPGFASMRTVGVLPVVASGNDATAAGFFQSGIADPACAPGAVSVGAVYDVAVDDQPCSSGGSAAADTVTCFSQTGPNLSLLAPGWEIAAADVTQGGTSQAAPHVAGAVAVLAGARPTASPYQLQRILETSGDPVPDTRSGSTPTKNRLDLPQALAAALPAKPIWADPPVFIGAPRDDDVKWTWWSSQSLTSAGSTRYIHNVKMNGVDYPAVEYMRSTQAGASWGNPRRLNMYGQVGDYAVTAGSGSYVYVAWIYWGSYDPYARILQFQANNNNGAGGSAWRPRANLSPENGYIDPPTMAASGTNVYLAWTDSATGNIRFRRSSDRGAHWSAPITIGTTTATDPDFGRSGTPVLAANGSYVTIAWIASNSGTLKQRMSTNRGGTWGTAINLDTNANYRPSIGVTGSRFAFAWTDSTGVRVRVWNAGSWLTSGARQVAPFNSGTYKLGYSAAVAVQGTGVIEVAWSACRLSGCAVSDTEGVDLVWRRSTNNGATWATGQTVLADSRRWQQRLVNDAADIDFVSSSLRHVAWNGYAPGYESRVYLLNGR